MSNVLPIQSKAIEAFKKREHVKLLASFKTLCNHKSIQSDTENTDEFDLNYRKLESQLTEVSKYGEDIENIKLSSILEFIVKAKMIKEEVSTYVERSKGVLAKIIDYQNFVLPLVNYIDDWFNSIFLDQKFEKISLLITVQLGYKLPVERVLRLCELDTNPDSSIANYFIEEFNLCKKLCQMFEEGKFEEAEDLNNKKQVAEIIKVVDSFVETSANSISKTAFEDTNSTQIKNFMATLDGKDEKYQLKISARRFGYFLSHIDSLDSFTMTLLASIREAIKMKRSTEEK